jgi:hypothetical protein
VAGSHRARPTRRGPFSSVPPWAIVLAVLVALLPAAWLGAHRLSGTHETGTARPSTGPSSDLPIPPVSPSGGTTAAAPTAPATTQPPSTSPTPAPRLPRVAPDTPRRLQSGTLIDAGFDSAASTITPGSTAEVARLGSRGSPGSPGTDTVYVIGSVRSTGDSAFGHLPDLEVGSAVTIRTDSGTLTYTVSASTLEPEAGLAADSLFTEHRAGRLVLVGIRYAASGNRLREALVVTAELTGAEKA